MSPTCPFCQPHMTAPILWENEHYRIIPDEYPRCVGHLLVISKVHQHNHMSIPLERLPIFELAQRQAFQFLKDCFGTVSFLENGGTHQEVPHAHLHCLPFTPSIPDGLIERKILIPLKNWQEVWIECKKIENYCYCESTDGHFICREANYKTLIEEIRTQITAQTEAKIEASTGDLHRGGPEMVRETVRLWEEWFQKSQ